MIATECERMEREALSGPAAQFSSAARSSPPSASKTPGGVKPLRIALATGDRETIDRFVAFFKAVERQSFPESERRAREAKLWPR